jgi:hypothetical protein
MVIPVGNLDVRYCVYRRQNGFARAPDARPSHWGSVARAVLAKIAAGEVAMGAVCER